MTTLHLRPLARTLSYALGATLALSACSSEPCRSVSGPFTSVVVQPPECQSAGNLCTHGALTGDLDAAYDFNASSQTMSMDPAHPGRIEFTGKSVITPTSDDGIINSDDTGFIDPDGKGGAAFETTVMMIGGTGSWEGTTGKLVASGTIDFMTGKTSGSYTGTLCEK